MSEIGSVLADILFGLPFILAGVIMIWLFIKLGVYLEDRYGPSGAATFFLVIAVIAASALIGWTYR